VCVCGLRAWKYFDKSTLQQQQQSRGRVEGMKKRVHHQVARSTLNFLFAVVAASAAETDCEGQASIGSS